MVAVFNFIRIEFYNKNINLVKSIYNFSSLKLILPRKIEDKKIALDLNLNEKKIFAGNFLTLSLEATQKNFFWKSLTCSHSRVIFSSILKRNIWRCG